MSKTLVLAATVAVMLFTMAAVLILYLSNNGPDVQYKVGVVVGLATPVVTALIGILKVEQVHKEVNGRLSSVESAVDEVKTEQQGTQAASTDSSVK